MRKQMPPIPPGEILIEEFLRPGGITQNQLARALKVPPGRINDIVRGKRGISCVTAARLAVFFGTSVEFWINLQARYDAKIAARDLVPLVAKRIRPRTKSAA